MRRAAIFCRRAALPGTCASSESRKLTTSVSAGYENFWLARAASAIVGFMAPTSCRNCGVNNDTSNPSYFRHGS